MDILAWTDCVRSSAGKISYVDIFSSSNLQKYWYFLTFYRGFKVFYNRRYFLNFRRYLRAVRGPGGGSSWNLAFCGPKNVLQRLQNIKCFWKKNPINFRVQISPRVKTMHNAWISPPISLLNISVYRLQPRLFIDNLPYLKKNQKDHKELRFRS